MKFICLTDQVINELEKELERLEDNVLAASEQNAERSIDAVVQGYSPYDIERIQTINEDKRIQEI